MTLIQARVALQQRVLPEYRAPFFDLLGASCIQGLGIFAGQPRENEAITVLNSLQYAAVRNLQNFHISRGKTYFCFQRGLTRCLDQWKPDVLIVEANPRYLSTPAAIRWMHRQSKPVIGWGLGAPKSGKAESALRRNFLHSLDAILAYSKTGADQYIAEGIDPDKVFIASNAVASRPSGTAPFRPVEYANGKACALFVGRLQERKNLDILLHACAALPQEIQPELIIVGDGPDRSRLAQLAQKIYPAAQFVGSKFGLELDTYFHKADLFVLPGTGGLAVQQAMSHALPVIVGEADGTQSELVRPENGWVLESAETSVLKETLLDAISDVRRLRIMGAASFRIVSEEINLENMVDSFAKAIKSVL